MIWKKAHNSYSATKTILKINLPKLTRIDKIWVLTKSYEPWLMWILNSVSGTWWIPTPLCTYRLSSQKNSPKAQKYKIWVEQVQDVNLGWCGCIQYTEQCARHLVNTKWLWDWCWSSKSGSFHWRGSLNSVDMDLCQDVCPLWIKLGVFPVMT